MVSSKISKKETFESALEKLENVVQRLENGDIELKDLLQQYTEGVVLSKFCLDQLASAEKAMDKIVRENGDTIEENELNIQG